MPKGVYYRPPELIEQLRSRVGNLPKDNVENPNWRGGKASHPLYYIYHDIKSRCSTPTHHRYADYGGRGIMLYPEWAEDFWKFVEGVGPRPDDSKTAGGRAYWQLDRIDNDGNYAPGNVRWATPEQQANNTRERTLQTHCRKGHEMTPENTRESPAGKSRRCRSCEQLNEKARQERRRHARDGSVSDI